MNYLLLIKLISILLLCSKKNLNQLNKVKVLAAFVGNLKINLLLSNNAAKAILIIGQSQMLQSDKLIRSKLLNEEDKQKLLIRIQEECRNQLKLNLTNHQWTFLKQLEQTEGSSFMNNTKVIKIPAKELV